MAGLSFQGLLFDFDGKEFGKGFNAAIRQLFRNGAKEFLRAALKTIPVRTGFVRGAFTVLEDDLGVGGAATFGELRLKKRERIEKHISVIEEKLKGVKERLEESARLANVKDIVNLKRQKALEAKLKQLNRKLDRLSKRSKGAQRIKELLTLARVKYGSDLETLEKLLKTTKEKPKTILTRDRDIKILERAIRKLTGTPPAAAHPTKVEIRPHKPGVAFPKERPISETVPRQYLEYYKDPAGDKIIKTLRSGRQFATFRFGLDNQKVKIDEELVDDILKTKYVFEYNIDITYFNIMDEFGHPSGSTAAWKSFANGRTAFLNYIRGNFKTLPTINSYFLRAIHTLDSSGTSTSSFERIKR